MGTSTEPAWDWDKDTLRSYGRALVLMAGVDEAGVTPDERATIGRMFVQIGIDDAGAAQIWSSPPEEAVVLSALEQWTDQCLRRSLLKDLLLVAHADGTYCDRESALMERLRRALRLDKEYETHALAWVRRGIEWQHEGISMCLDGTK